MQNFHGGDFSDVQHQKQDNERRRLQDKPFNDSHEAYNCKVQAEVDKNVKYCNDLKQQCEENTRRVQYQYEESHVERKLQDFEIGMAAEFQSLTERERKQKEKDDLTNRMCSDMMADEVDRQEREHALEVRHEKENREKNLREDMEAQDKWEGDRRDLRDGLLSQIEENKQSVRDEKQRDLMYRDQAYAIMEAEDEREKERVRKKREADDQYYADLRQQIQDNAVRRQKQKELDNAQ